MLFALPRLYSIPTYAFLSFLLLHFIIDPEKEEETNQSSDNACIPIIFPFFVFYTSAGWYLLELVLFYSSVWSQLPARRLLIYYRLLFSNVCWKSVVASAGQ